MCLLGMALKARSHSFMKYANSDISAYMCEKYLAKIWFADRTSCMLCIACACSAACSWVDLNGKIEWAV